MEKRSGLSTVLIYIIVIALVFLPELGYMLEDAALPAWLTNDYARIVDMDYKAVVVDEPGSDGKIVVTERMTFDIHAASRSNGFWELWRDLCEDTIDGAKVHYKVNSVKLITSSGEEIPWEESPKLYWDDYDYVSSIYGPEKWYHSPGPYSESRRQYECVFFYIDDVYREKMTFEIEYEMYNAALRYGDCSDLYIAMYSGDTTRYLESFNAEILIPDKDMPREGNYEYTTYGTNANSFDVKESKTKNPGYHTFYFSLDEDDLKFRPYNEYIEFDLLSYGEDKHIFTEYASSNYYYNDPALDEIRDEQRAYANEPAAYVTIKLIALAICLGASTLILIFSKKKISNLSKRYPSSDNPKDIEAFRDIPSDLDPKFAAALVACKDKKPESDAGVYSSLLLSLARKKYVTLSDTSYGTMMIKLNDVEPPAPITGFSDAPSANQVMGRFGPYTPATQNLESRYVHDNDGSISDYLSQRQPGYVSNDVVVDANNITRSGVLDGNNIRRDDPDVRRGVSLSQLNNALNNLNGSTPQPIVGDAEWDAPSNTSWVDVEPEVPAEPIIEREPLTPSEEVYYKLLKRHAYGGEVAMTTLQSRVSEDYDYTRSFVDKINKVVVDVGIGNGYFQKINYKEPKKQLEATSAMSIVVGIIAVLANLLTYQTRLDLIFGGLFILGAALIYNGLYLKKHSHKYVLLTEFGEEEYKKWRGLYNFLNSDTLIKDREVVELPLWEKYLVYATAFDISEKVIAAIRIRCPEMNPESIVSNPVCRSGRLHTSSRSFHSHVRSGYHGGGGGGGGYGGGGRGGGGGGGGH